MPITISAQKALRQSFRRKAKNTQKKTKLKNLLKEMRELIGQKKADEAKKILPKVYKELDKAAKTGLIKKKTADRKKSRITKALSKVL